MSSHQSTQYAVGNGEFQGFVGSFYALIMT